MGAHAHCPVALVESGVWSRIPRGRARRGRDLGRFKGDEREGGRRVRGDKRTVRVERKYRGLDKRCRRSKMLVLSAVGSLTLRQYSEPLPEGNSRLN